MCNARLYHFWGDLIEALQTGKRQNEIKHFGKPLFDELYRDPARLEQFMAAMQGISLGDFYALADKLDFSKYETVCDGSYRLNWSPALAEIVGEGRPWTVLMISLLPMPWR